MRRGGEEGGEGGRGGGRGGEGGGERGGERGEGRRGGEEGRGRGGGGGVEGDRYNVRTESYIIIQDHKLLDALWHIKLQLHVGDWGFNV